MRSVNIAWHMTLAETKKSVQAGESLSEIAKTMVSYLSTFYRDKLFQQSRYKEEK